MFLTMAKNVPHFQLIDDEGRGHYMHCPISDNECPQVDNSKFQRVKVNIAFHKTLEDTSKMDAEGESLNKCSEI